MLFLDNYEKSQSFIASWIQLNHYSVESNWTKTDQTGLVIVLKKYGLDKHGLEKHGLEKHGLEKHSVDKHGLDKHGLDMVSILF